MLIYLGFTQLKIPFRPLYNFFYDMFTQFENSETIRNDTYCSARNTTTNTTRVQSEIHLENHLFEIFFMFSSYLIINRHDINIKSHPKDPRLP